MGISDAPKPKLLIAEDDVENQEFLEFFLEKYFSVDVCDSSDTFYEMLDQKRYDIILMDISIKGKKNGLDLTKELKNNPNHSEIPVICYTAHALYKDRINALDAGCDAYISKPSDTRLLLDTLFNLLKAKGKFFLDNTPTHLSGLAIT